MTLNFEPLPRARDDEGTAATDDDEPLSQHQCVVCRTTSPATRTAHTLISAQHGWRVGRTALKSGGFLFEWHCPTCWARARKQKGSAL